MFTVRISHRYFQDNWFVDYEFLTRKECYDYIERNYDIEDPDTPYQFSLIDDHGNMEWL